MDSLSKAISLSFLLHSTLICGVVVLSRSAVLFTPQLVIDFSIESAYVIAGKSEEPISSMADIDDRKDEPTARLPVENERNDENKKRIKSNGKVENQHPPKNLPRPQKTVAPKVIADDLKKTDGIERRKPTEPDTGKQEISSPNQVGALSSPIYSELKQTTSQATSQVNTNSEDQALNQVSAKNNGTDSVQNTQEQFIANHFEYIRKLIMQNLSFPAAAQKMGWYGRLIVSFIIREDGNVEDINIVSGSGHDMLDANVIKAIHKTVPFPKPPEKAKIILPIIYNLK